MGIEDAARSVGLSYQTLRKAVERQELPVVKEGRRVLVTVASLRRWLESKEETWRCSPTGM
jgi:excisionase family DNA binding protein